MGDLLRPFSTSVLGAFAALLAAAPLSAGNSNFAGGWVGISTLSADGRSVTSSGMTEISLYKPENGLSTGFFIGRHLTNHFSLQGSYLWNRNSLRLTSSRSSEEEFRFYEQERKATTHSVIGELLFFVRDRDSRFRPYLSVGGGVVNVSSGEGRIVSQSPQPFEAPGEFDSSGAALRVAVGVDIFFGGSWAFRFTFSETIRSNPISAALTPPGNRNLANFQNLFGFTKTF